MPPNQPVQTPPLGLPPTQTPPTVTPVGGSMAPPPAARVAGNKSGLIVGVIIGVVLVLVIGAAYWYGHIRLSAPKVAASQTVFPETITAAAKADSNVSGKSTGSQSVVTGVQQKARDTERQTDINALQGQLEAFFAQNGYYPTLTHVNSAIWRAQNLRGLDKDALIDPLSTKATLVAKPAKNVYAYQVTDMDGGSCEAHETKCAMYTLTATLETIENGSHTFQKQSLN